MTATTVAVLGLGEAGSALVADLLSADVTVRAHDPRVAAPAGTVACSDEADAVCGAELVLSVNSADDAVPAARAGRPALSTGAIWADLNTASPTRKAEVADALPPGACVDVALMAPVPGRGLRTPMLASGPGAEEYADLVGGWGAQVTVLGAEVGTAATRKLLRSVFFKGLSAAVVEALAAAETQGLGEWMRSEIGAEFDRLAASWLPRIEEGSRRHAVRRSHEMAAAAEMVAAVGVPPRISLASREWLADLAAG